MPARLCLIALSCAAAVAWTGCVGLPHADAADVERAQKRWPGTDAKTLEQGRQMYVLKCGGCHTLYLPESRTPQQWPQLVEEMSENGGLDDHQRDLIEQFLVTMAERKPTSDGAVGASAR